MKEININDIEVLWDKDSINKQVKRVAKEINECLHLVLVWCLPFLFYLEILAFQKLVCLLPLVRL